MPTCLVGLGANLGDRQATLTAAAMALAAEPAIQIGAVSQWYETAPVGGPAGQPAFLNGAVRIETLLPPAGLLAVLQRIESQFGRTRQVRWGARTLDLDLLLYGDLVQRTVDLELPHPRMAFRRFLLEPAAEVARDMVHPQIGWTVGRLLEHLNTAPNYVAITGLPRAGKRQLAEAVAAALPGTQVLTDRHGGDGSLRPTRHGTELQVEIECLEARAARLDAARWESLRTSGQLLVSDFWLDQSLAYARVRMPACEWTVVWDQFERLRPRVIAPKLVVLVDRTERCVIELARELIGAHRFGDLAGLAGLPGVLVETATRPGVGPLLRLPGEDVQADAAELTAAIEAMR